MDKIYDKPWAILKLLGIMVELACASGKLSAKPTGSCPITQTPFDSDPVGDLCSVHPCMHWMSAEGARHFYAASSVLPVGVRPTCPICRSEVHFLRGATRLGVYQ